MDKFVSVTEAKAQLSGLIDHVLEGNQVVITRHGKPTVRLIIEQQPPLLPGLLRDMFPEACLSEIDLDSKDPEIERQWALWRENLADLDL